MIRHIVAFRLAAELSEIRDQDARRIKERLEALIDVVPQIASLHVGIDDGAAPGHWHVVLVSEFETGNDLAIYQAHPEHTSVISLVNQLISDRAVVDYTI